MAEARKIRLHRLIGEQGETVYGERAGEIAAELAVHFERGHDTQRAIQYRQQAGQNALRRSAHQEAIVHLTTGLELLDTLPDTPERAQEELTLRNALAPVLIATKGYTAFEVEDHFTRASTLLSGAEHHAGLIRYLETFVTKGADVLKGLFRSGIRQIGFPTLIGFAAFYLVRGELQTARTIGEQALKMAKRARDIDLLLAAHVVLGIVLFYDDQFLSAREHMEQVTTHYDPQKHHTVAFRYAYDPGVTALSILVIILVLFGYPEQAREKIRVTLTLAQKLSHPFSLSFARGSVAIGYQFLNEPWMVQEQTEALISLTSAQRFPLWSAVGTILHGWTLAAQDEQSEGLTQLRRGLMDHQTTRAKVGRTYYLGLLAETYTRGGQTQDGFVALTEALETVRKSKECVYEAELYRLKGELTLQQFQVSGSEFQGERGPKSSKAKAQILNPKSQEEAEACFLKAIEVSQKQQAKLLELRATTSLARLWHQQGKKKQAHGMLAEVYNWFTEGFDTKDLQEAKALIEELRH
jgi:predicted ATPase